MRRDDRLIGWNERETVDCNGNGLDDDLEPPEVDVEAGANELRIRIRRATSCSPLLTCGDVDAQWEMAESAGDETASASGATPGQSVVEEIGLALGLTYEDGELLKVGEKERERDRHRWELDPASADDYYHRLHDGAPRSRYRKCPFVK